MKHQDRDSGRCLSPDRSYACCNIVSGITRSANGRSARHGAASNTPVDINVERALLRIAAAGDCKIRPRNVSVASEAIISAACPGVPTPKSSPICLAGAASSFEDFEPVPLRDRRDGVRRGIRCSCARPFRAPKAESDAAWNDRISAHRGAPDLARCDPSAGFKASVPVGQAADAANISGEIRRAELSGGSRQ